jgi:TonB-linked SusC/RagA family outer membrane protein
MLLKWLKQPPGTLFVISSVLLLLLLRPIVGLAQEKKYSIKFEQSSLEQALILLRKTTNESIAFNKEETKYVTVKQAAYNGKTVEEILNGLVANVPFSIERKGATWIVKKSMKMPVQPTSKKGHGIVTGKIIDEETNQPIADATITIDGKGSTTDASGAFAFSLPEGSYTATVSYVGFTTKEIKSIIVKDNESLVINAAIQKGGANALDEVVVVGYGTQRKVNLTGAITQVNAEEIENRMTPNIVSALQGLIPNLNISYGNAGGEPGASPNFNLRGPGSLSGGSPFVLIDGVPQSISNINTNDIESISVLKDASASAIYGVRAAYGVILITTKKGKTGKPKISYSSHLSLQRPTTLPDIVNSVQFATMVNDAFANAGQGVKYSPELIEKMKQIMANPNSLPSMVPNSVNTNNWDESQLYGNTNSYDVFFKKLAFNQDHNISISGGNAISYYLSGGYYGQGSQYRYGDEYFHRYTLTSNLSTKLTDWLKIGLNSKYIRREIQMPHVYPLIGDYYHDIPRRWPVWPTLDPNGHYAINTLALMADGGRDVSEENQLLNSFIVELTLAKNWKINADLNVNQQFNSSSDNAKTVYMYRVDNTPVAQSYSVPNSIAISNSKETYSSNNIYTTYDQKLGGHTFKLMVGMQSELNKSEGISVSKAQLISDNVPFITTATGVANLSGSKTHWGTFGFFGRLNYNYNEKYLFEFTSRYDGSSRFQKDKRWGFFPSFSAGYNIAKENFWDALQDKVSMLKLRASYGTLGNQSISGNFPYLSNLGINTNLDWVMGTERPLYVTAPGLVSPDLTWESTTTLNFGLDAEAFKNRMSFSFDWYNRTTDNMFGPVESYPALLGVSAPRRNNASIETKGFELSIGWRDNISKHLGYQVKLMLSDNTTTVTKYRNTAGILSDYYEGQKLGQIIGYETLGLFQSADEVAKAPNQAFLGSGWGPGDVRYKDQNGDNKIDKGKNTVIDMGDQKIIGNNLPRYSYSGSFGINWKGFELDMLWQGVAKRDIWLGGNFLFGDAGNFNQITIFKEHLDYWRPDNTGAYYPKPYMTALTNKNITAQSRYLQDASYLRLKNLQLGYTFPTALVNKIGLGNLRFYLTGENLFTFTKMLAVFDPENTTGSIGPGKNYPLATTYAFGIQLNLK